MAKPICVVTGAGGGVGTALAEHAADLGFDLVIHGRTESKLIELKRRLEYENDGIGIEIVAGDLATVEGARSTAAAIGECAPAINLLISNAGVLLDGIKMSDDDLEMHTQVNLIAPYVLMQSLKPNLACTKGTIVNVSSSMAKRARDLSVDELKTPRKAQKLVGAYARSKLALSVVTRALAHDFSDRGITLLSADPGRNRTDMTAGSGMPFLLVLLRPLLYSTPEKGARRIFEAINAAQTSTQPGLFYHGSRSQDLPEFTNSSETVTALLDFCSHAASDPETGIE